MTTDNFKDPILRKLLEVLLPALHGMIEEVANGRISSQEWDTYKIVIAGCIEGMEKRFKSKKASKPPLSAS